MKDCKTIAEYLAGLPEEVRADFSSLWREIRKLVPGGEEAIRYLSGTGEYTDRAAHPLPFLVLLDVKLPGRNGIEVLQWIRANHDHSIVVVMLSSSAQPRDVIQAAKSNCNSYLVKPDSLQELVRLVELIKAYWIERNQWIR